MASPATSRTFSPLLAISYARATVTFLSPQSNLAININSSAIATVLSSNTPGPVSGHNPGVLKTIPGQAYPPPENFAGARHEVEHMLRASLTTFVSTCAQGNAGLAHLLCGMTIAATSTLCGLIPILFQIFRPGSAVPRSIRLAAIPCIWIGLYAFLCALNGVCVIVWMFGEGRQLKDFELARPKISGVVSHTTMMPLQAPRLRALDSSEAREKYAHEDGGSLARGYRMSEIKLGYPNCNTDAFNSSSVAHTLPPSPASAVTSLEPSHTSAQAGVDLSSSINMDQRGASVISLSFDPANPTSFTSSRFRPPGMGGVFVHDALGITTQSSAESATGGDDASPHSSSFSSSATEGASLDLPPPPAPLSDATPKIWRSKIPFLAPTLSFKDPALKPRPHCRRSVCTGLKAVYHELFGCDTVRYGPRPGFFGPMTYIGSDVIQRSNWEVVVKAVVLATILTASIMGAFWAVPTNGRS